jgi:toxin ParE1/3/4
MAEYRLTPVALQDLDDIFEHSVAEWGLAVALRYTEDLEAAFAMLASAPQRGRSCETIRPGYRRFGVASHVIYYQATDYGIAVTRILNQRMDAPRHL